MTVVLTPQEMEALRSIDSPTMANAIEPLKLRHRAEGFMGPDIRCYYPDMGVMVGYAVTAKINTVYGDRPLSRNNWFEFLEAMQSVPEPRVLVMEDESVPSGRACFHGEIICSAHNRLGIIGLVTNGPSGTWTRCGSSASTTSRPAWWLPTASWRSAVG